MVVFVSGASADSFYQYQVDFEYTPCYMISYTLAMLLSLLFTSFGIRIALSIRFVTVTLLMSKSKFRAYHPNVNRLYCFALFVWITLFISKSCIFLYQIRGYNGSRAVDKNSPGFVFLRMSAFLRFFYFFFGSAAPLSVAIERAFATKLLDEYEKTSKCSVFVLIVTIKTTSALFFATLAVFFEMQFITFVSVVSACLITCFFLLNVLYRYNLRRMRRLNNYHRDTQYTLSKRFQLRENIRILSLLMKMIYAVCLMIFLIAVGLVLPRILNVGHLTSDPMRNLADFCVHCNPLIVIPLTVLLIPEFKKAAHSALSKRVQMARSSVDSHQRGYKTGSNQGDIYFDQFKKSMSGSEKSTYPVTFMKRYT